MMMMSFPYFAQRKRNRRNSKIINEDDNFSNGRRHKMSDSIVRRLGTISNRIVAKKKIEKYSFSMDNSL